MVLVWVIVGFLGQCMLAAVLAMFVFASTSILHQRIKLSEQQNKVLNISLLTLPGLSVFAGLMLIWFYLHGADARYYYWHLLPVSGAIIYVLYLTLLRLFCPKIR